MSRIVCIAAAALTLGYGTTASAAPVPVKAGTSLFAAAPIGDERLAAIVGTGRGRLVSLADDDWYGFQRQSAALIPVTFDNWWHDVGNQIIAANILMQRGGNP